MREIIYYILAAVGGGILSEINNEKKGGDFKRFFIRGFTSVMVGIIFGLLIKEITGNVNITIAMTAVAGVMGMPSVELLVGGFKDKVNKSLNSNPKKDER